MTFKTACSSEIFIFLCGILAMQIPVTAKAFVPVLCVLNMHCICCAKNFEIISVHKPNNYNVFIRRSDSIT